MKNNLKYILVAVFVVMAGLAAWNINTTNEDTSKTQTTQEISDISELVINEEGTVVNYQGVLGETALETLKNFGIDVRTETSDFGEFVTGIDKVDAESNVNFWGFYVNGEQASVGAGSYVAEEGDQIEWRIEEIIF